MFAVISNDVINTKFIAPKKFRSNFDYLFRGFVTGKDAASPRILQETAPSRCAIHEVMDGMKLLAMLTEAIEARLNDPAASVFPVPTFWTGGHGFRFTSRK